MSKENLKNVPTYKQSFKAVENFLRRVAFNLGNTQSRTEVKIISCIPIDVTDLQQRIFQLQNELADVKDKAKEPPKNCTTCARRAEIYPKQVFCNERLLSATSVLSVSCPGGCSSTQLSQIGSVEPIVAHDRIDNATKTDTTKNKTFFAKKKKEYKKKVRSRLVYCTQTDTNSPFNNKFSLSDDITPMKAKAGNNDENINRSYLADVIKRQYKQQPLANEFSNLSDISSPVCRDQVPTCSPFSPCLESDVCSCFHGQYQNIDKYMINKNNINKYYTSEAVRKFNGNAYYDSKFYDLVPVKENINKNRSGIDRHWIREPKKHIIKCWPEEARPKHSHKHASPTLLNYCTVSPPQEKRTRCPVSLPNDKHAAMSIMAARRFTSSKPRRLNELDLGPVYAKQVRKHKQQNSITITAQRHDVAAGSTTVCNIVDHQTAATAATITDPPEDKTEATLKQIKTMLQSVLTEVKTNSNVKPPVQSKKDAVVQNEPVRGYECGASQLLQSYTYSSYNMNSFMPSCSHPISCNVYPEFPGTQGISFAANMPFQQYPLLIQRPKHLCNNYYRNSNFNKPITKHAASTATNTEQVQERSKETEQLIKEIYKSMALGMEESSKDNSFREYTTPKVTANDYVKDVKMESDKESRRMAQAISEIFRNTHPRDSTVTGTTDTSLNSYLKSDRAKVVSKDAIKKDNKFERNYPQNEHTTKYRRDRETERMSTHHEAEEQSDNTLVEESEESSAETESSDLVEVKKEPVQTAEVRKEKSGILKKMLKMFQSRRRRIRRDDVISESEKVSESDSDDYQTVYSHKVEDATPKSKKVQSVRSRPHSKVFYSKQPQKRRSRTESPEKLVRTSPYMEQEYRRYWNEKLMSHENQRNRYSTGESGRAPDRPQRHSYYQTYEARPVLVDPNTQVTRRMPGNVLKPQYTTSKNHYTRHTKNGNEFRPNNPGYNNYQSDPNNVRNIINTGTSGPYFVTSKSNGSCKGMFAKRWLKKCNPQCAQQWKELIVNG